jgi:drug/metabolite transporter (DMT)-like permease
MIEWYYLSIISAIFSATAAVLQKKVLFKERALSFATTLALFNLVLAIPFFFFIDVSSLSLLNLGVLFFKSILGAFAFLFVMLGIKNLELSHALPLLVLTPGLVALFAFFILGESISALALLGMVLLLLGTYLLQLGEHARPSEPFRYFIKSKGHKYILFALLLFTITSLLDKALLKQFGLPLNAFMGFQHLFYGLVFIVFIMFTSGGFSELKGSFRGSWKWILLIAFVTIGYRYAHLGAVKSASSVALALSMKRTAVFFAVVLGGKLFKEHDYKKRILSTLIMVIGAILIIMF